MKRRLFEDLVVSAAGGSRARAGLGWPVSVSLHAAGVAALLAAPVLTTEALPDPPSPLRPIVLARMHLEPAPPPVPVPRPVRGGRPRAGRVVSDPRVRVVPKPVMETPTLIQEEETPVIEGDDRPICIGCDFGRPGPAEDTGGPPSGNGTGVGTGPVPVGGLIRPPAKMRDARPIYPEIARIARVQGLVQIECIIATDGRVDEMRIVSGPPLLQEAALDAVRQWRYTPTLLNGVAVPVVMTVTVKFTLS